MSRVGVAAFVITLAACGGSAQQASTTAAPPTSTTTTNATTSTGEPGITTAATTTVGVSTTTVTTLPAVDALTWDRVAHDEAVFGGSSTQAMLGLAAGETLLVAVGYDESGGDRDAAVWVSADGVTWERITHNETVLGGANDQEMRSVVADGSGFIAVGYDQETSEIHAAVWLSQDGFDWTRLPHQPVFAGGFWKVMSAITAGGPGFVAAGYTLDPTPTRPLGEQSAAVWTSSDGVAWQRVPHNEAAFGGDGFQQILGLAAGGPGVVAVGDDSTGYGNAAVWVSSDGTSWSRVPHDETVFGGTGVQVIHAVIAGGPGLVAVGGRWLEDEPGDFFAAVWVSADGYTWESIPHDPAVFGGRGEQQMYAVTVAGPGLVAVGSDSPWTGGARVWVSPDGLSWNRVVLPDGVRPVIGPDDVPGVPQAGLPWYAIETIRGVVAGGPGLVAVGQSWVAEGGGSAAVIISS